MFAYATTRMLDAATAADRVRACGVPKEQGFVCRQVFNLTVVARTPTFSNKLLRMVATGWSMSDIYRLSTGTPFTVLSGLDQALNGFGAQRANQLSTDIYAPNKGTSCPGVTTAACISWLNNGTLGQAAAFAQPALGTYGNLSVLNVRGPAFFQFDTALTRQFRIREHQILHRRREQAVRR